MKHSTVDQIEVLGMGADSGLLNPSDFNGERERGKQAASVMFCIWAANKVNSCMDGREQRDGVS